MSDNDFKKKENFKKALGELRNYCKEPILSNRDRSGVVQGFEFTFETCWKMIQHELKTSGEGLPFASPKQCLESALNLGWLSSADEKYLVNMLNDRNLTVHTYDQSFAMEVADRIKEKYLPIFEKILKSI